MKIAVALTVTFLGACSGAEPDAHRGVATEPLTTLHSDAGHYKVDVRTGPVQPPTRGTTDVELTVTNEAGEPQDGLSLTAVPWMVTHAHGTSIAPTITAEGAGKYLVSNVVFFMPGRWQLRTSVQGAVADTFAPTFDIPLSSVPAVPPPPKSVSRLLVSPAARHAGEAAFVAPSPRPFLLVLLAIGALCFPRLARAQACCSGGAAITPARLLLHEDMLVGLQVRGASVTGAFDAKGHYRGSAAGSSEIDLEQDVLAAVRVLGRGQMALQVPWLQTRRTAAGRRELGGGLGDINLGVRYDVSLAGQSQTWPGMAFLAGVTLPTGRPPDDATNDLATDATGIGAYQGTIGIAFEQTFGPWFFGVNGLASKRTQRSARGIVETLGTRGTIVAASAFTFANDAALGVSISYAVEAAPVLDGVAQADAAQRQTTVSAVGLLPLRDAWRLQASVFATPMVAHLSKNEPASLGGLLTVVRSWS